uniref:Putative secreted protein n=1 Tax=Anopheles marajoara TaxID=58244 RepID=A0A2M4CA71_9DIPT
MGIPSTLVRTSLLEPPLLMVVVLRWSSVIYANHRHRDATTALYPALYIANTIIRLGGGNCAPLDHHPGSGMMVHFNLLRQKNTAKWNHFQG